MLKRHLAPETLERLLRNELLPKEKEEESTLVTKMTALFRGKREANQDGEDGKK